MRDDIGGVVNQRVAQLPAAEARFDVHHVNDSDRPRSDPELDEVAVLHAAPWVGERAGDEFRVCVDAVELVVPVRVVGFTVNDEPCVADLELVDGIHIVDDAPVEGDPPLFNVEVLV